MNNPDLAICLIGLAIVIVWISLSLWAGTDMNSLLAYDTADFKRGMLVWSRPLPEDIKQFLLELPHDIVTPEGFIKSNGTQVLIYAQERHNGRVQPYIAYVDLETDDPHIEYRTAPSALVFPLFVALTIIFIPFLVYWLIWSSRVWEKNTLDFIRRELPTPHSAT